MARPKGMRDIEGEEFYIYQGFFEKAAEIASYYGFGPIETPLVEKEEVFTTGIGTENEIVEKEMYALKVKGGASLVMRPEGTAGIVRAYVENGMYVRPQPVMFYYYGPYFRYERPQKGRFREFYQFGLETIGTERSVADAITIKITIAILEEVCLKDLSVLINTIGDSVCRPNYIKELITYYKKHLNDVCAHCRQRIKVNPLRLLDCKSPECQSIKQEAPEMLEYVCEPCKKHFKEVLEHLDMMEIPYTIDHTLVRGIDYYTRTVFEVVTSRPLEEEIPTQKKEAGEESEETKTEEEGTDEEGSPEKEKEPEKKEEEEPPLALAGGGRYDTLAKSFGSKRDVAGVGVGLGVDRIIIHPDFKAHMPRIIKKPKAFFIQIGTEAKLKSIPVIEALRKAKTPVVHSLSKDKLASQLSLAEKMNIPYTIILGQREALEGTVIVRDMNSHSQETVKIEDLADKLKKA
ncbi:MAG: histidine--tRNA ligase [Candidatus Paceibacterota bacterium]